MLVQDLFENRMHDAYSVFQQLAGAVHNSEDIDLRVGHELMPLQSWQARHLLGQYKSIAKRQGPDAAMRFLADYNAITAALDAMDTRVVACPVNVQWMKHTTMMNPKNVIRAAALAKVNLMAQVVVPVAEVA